ncbi:MAG: type II CAAX endopeptidase family protein [Verrucomicrobiota bacterium]
MDAPPLPPDGSAPPPVDEPSPGEGLKTHEAAVKGPSPVISWVVIILSILAIFFGSALVEEDSGEMEAYEDATALTMMELQSKAMIGLARFDRHSVGREMEKLESFAGSPAVARALAVVNAYLASQLGEARGNVQVGAEGGELKAVAVSTGWKRAVALLDRFEDELTEEDQELHGLARRMLGESGELTADEETLVQEKMGWYGEVLTALGKEPGDPLRLRIQRSGTFCVALMGFAFAFGFLVFIGGLIGLIIFLVRLYQGSVTMRFQRESPHARYFLQAFAVYMGAFLLAQLILPLLADENGQFLGINSGLFGIAGVAMASLLGVFWPGLRGVPWKETWRGLGLHRGEGVFKEVLCGLGGYAMALPIFAIGVFLTFMLMIGMGLMSQLSSGGGDAEEASSMMSHPLVVWMSEGGIGIRIGALLLAAAFAPIFEEIMFRGALYRGMRRTWPWWSTGLVMAFIFAIVHPQGIVAVPALASLGFSFGLIREWRDSVIAPMTAHALHNGTLVMVMWILFSL